MSTGHVVARASTGRVVARTCPCHWLRWHKPATFFTGHKARHLVSVVGVRTRRATSNSSIICLCQLDARLRSPGIVRSRQVMEPVHAKTVARATHVFAKYAWLEGVHKVPLDWPGQLHVSQIHLSTAKHRPRDIERQLPTRGKPGIEPVGNPTTTFDLQGLASQYHCYLKPINADCCWRRCGHHASKRHRSPHFDFFGSCYSFRRHGDQKTKLKTRGEAPTCY